MATAPGARLPTVSASGLNCWTATEQDPEPLSTTKPATAASKATEGPASPPKPPRTHAFLVGYPRHCAWSPTGRGGKGFVAYDLDRNRCSFLKDYWYARTNSVHPETEVYQRLGANDVPYVATLVAGHDVEAQETLTQKYLPENGRPPASRHHRFVVEEIGRPLETYDTAEELCAVLSFALLGEAYSFP